MERCGRGGYGQIYRCKHKLDGKIYAVKEIPFNEEEREEVLREVIALSSLYHSNIVRYHQAWIDKYVQINAEKAADLDDSGESEEKEHCLYIQMEFCPGSLDQDLKGKETMERAWTYFHQIVEASSLIHAKGIIHRDLCPQNILLDEFKSIKISDFGLAKFCEENKTSTITSADKKGHKLYMAPEMKTEGSEISSKVDMFNAGLILYELFHPFGDTQSERIEVLQELRDKKSFPAETNEHLTADEQKLRSLILKLLTAEPKERPSAEEILQDPPWPIQHEARAAVNLLEFHHLPIPE